MRTRRTAALLRAAALGLTVLAGGAGSRAPDRHDATDGPDAVPDAADDTLDDTLDESGDGFDDAS
jgi:hypothetical protein